MSSVTNGASQPFFFFPGDEVRSGPEAVDHIRPRRDACAKFLIDPAETGAPNPERSICTAMPGYCASKARPSFSPTGRSIEEYRITLCFLRAASTSAGVIANRFQVPQPLSGAAYAREAKGLPSL